MASRKIRPRSCPAVFLQPLDSRLAIHLYWWGGLAQSRQDLFVRHAQNPLVLRRKFREELTLLRSWLRHSASLRLERCRVLKALQFFCIDSAQPDHFWIDPRFGIDRLAFGGRKLKHNAFRCGQVDGLAEAVINRPHDPVSMRAYPITHRQQLCFGIDVEGDMLHDARSDRRCVPGGMGDSLDGLDFTNLWYLDERDRGTVDNFEKTMKGVFDIVNQINRDD